MKDCLFCNLEENYIFENQYFYSVFDAHPVSPGHALVIPKEHIVSLFDLENEKWEYMGEAIKKTVETIKKTDFKELYQDMKKQEITKGSPKFCEKMLRHPAIDKKPDGYNIGNNEGIAGGRSIHHLHIQIIPRYMGDVDKSIGGIRNVVSELGDYT